VTFLKDNGLFKYHITTKFSFEKVLASLIPVFTKKSLDKGFCNYEVLKEYMNETENKNKEEDGVDFPTLVVKYDFLINKLFKIRRAYGK
jgi:hypothetical protein